MVRSSQSKSLETIAVYWEQRVKTYGFQTMENLSLIELAFPPARMASIGFAIQKLAVPGAIFHLALVNLAVNHLCKFYLLTGREFEDEISSNIGKLISHKAGESLSLKSPVDLIFFQGPHYGDRYGIAEAAFSALQTHAVPILVAACSQSCIYLVLPCGKAKEARTLLAQVFQVPKKRLSSKKASSKFQVRK